MIRCPLEGCRWSSSTTRPGEKDHAFETHLRVRHSMADIAAALSRFDSTVLVPVLSRSELEAMAARLRAETDAIEIGDLGPGYYTDDGEFHPATYWLPVQTPLLRPDFSDVPVREWDEDLLAVDGDGE